MTGASGTSGTSGATTTNELDALIIGAGVAGLYQLHLLRNAGLRVKAYDAASNVGGTWYWNRYPGSKFDSEGYIYQYLFSEKLYKDWSWSEKFPAQPEIEHWLNYVADHLDLRKDIEFNTRIASAHFNEAAGRWTIRTDGGETIDAQFLITCCGMLSAPLIDVFPGQDTFTGRILHTGQWPKQPIDLAGKRVGVVGIGATGIQVIQTIASQVGHLKVFVRTPQYVLPMKSPKYGPAEAEAYKARFDELQQTLPQTFTGFEYDFEHKWADLTPERRREVLEEIWSDGSLKLWLASFAEIFFDESVSEAVSEFVREKMRARLKDPALCEMLIPTDYGFGTHRVPLGDQLSRGLSSAERRGGQRQGQSDRARGPGGSPDGRRHGPQARHHHPRHRLRCRHRCSHAHRHPRQGRTVAEGGLGQGHPHHHGPSGARLPEPVHDGRAARTLGGLVQHDHLPAAAGRVDQRLHQIHAAREQDRLRANEGDGGPVGGAP